MADTAFAPGRIIAGKYRVERALGAGGMGMVVAATHLTLGNLVAIKVLLTGHAKSAEHEARFTREGRVAARLRSQHAGRVLDVARTETGEPYIVMELLQGLDLAACLVTRGVLPVEDAVGYVLQACEPLAEMHSLGMIHRDIKPANLFLDTGVDGAPIVKLVDFGVVKEAGAEAALTQTGTALGSPLYMSPEQLRGHTQIDARSDVWSLGVTLYELLTGVTPFHANSIVDLCARVMHGRATPLARYRPDIPAGLETAIGQCFQLDPALRYPDVASFAGAIAPYAPARLAHYVERIAAVQKLDVVPSKRTIELAPPSFVAPAVSTATPVSSSVRATNAAAALVATIEPTKVSALPLPVRPPSERRPWILVGVMMLAALAGLAILWFSLAAKPGALRVTRAAAPEPTASAATTITSAAPPPPAAAPPVASSMPSAALVPVTPLSASAPKSRGLPPSPPPRTASSADDPAFYGRGTQN